VDRAAKTGENLAEWRDEKPTGPSHLQRGRSAITASTPMDAEEARG
jgi:hypothetical protein